MLRKTLDWLYTGAAWMAALCMVSVLCMVLLTIVSRLMNFYVPGTDAYAGYAMAGAGFLALAHTLKHGEHIRVTLLIGRLTGTARRGMELWALSVSVLLSGVLAFYAMATGVAISPVPRHLDLRDATPLWIPQVVMGIGTTILLVALLDEWVLELLGRRVHRGGEAHHE
jgi:TRAP-type C4-dicarboxylate transport system permease small subunit